MLSFFGVNRFVFAAVLVAFLAGGAIGWHQKSLRIPALLEAQKTADAEACLKEQNNTKERNDALIKERNRIAADAARYKRMHRNACIYPTGAGKLQPTGGEHADVHGISAEWLHDYAALCETYRVELIDCAQ
jgi:hypothetical protein